MLGSMYFFLIEILFLFCLFFRYILRSRTAGSYGSYIFSILRNIYTVSCSVCCKLHFHQQWGRVPFSPYPHQNLLFSYPSLCFVFFFWTLLFSDDEWCWTPFHVLLLSIFKLINTSRNHNICLISFTFLPLRYGSRPFPLTRVDTGWWGLTYHRQMSWK